MQGMASNPSHVSRPPFITFEGGEGAGKSTQIDLLSQNLRAAGQGLIATREPGGSTGAEDIRALLVTGDPDRWTPLTEALLNYAARQEHLEQMIRPALERGDWVLCDRFSDSTFAYQGYAGGVSLEALEQLDKLIVGDWAPDLTFILDLDPAEGLRRAGARHDAEDRYERKGLLYHQDIREAFLKIAETHSDRCRVIDGAQSADAIASEIWTIVQIQFDPNSAEAG